MKSLMLFRCKFLAELPVLMSKKNMKNMVHQSRIFHKMINEYICISFFFRWLGKLENLVIGWQKLTSIKTSNYFGRILIWRIIFVCLLQIILVH